MNLCSGHLSPDLLHIEVGFPGSHNILYAQKRDLTSKEIWV